MSSDPEAPGPRAPCRCVHHGDGIQWLEQAALTAEHAVVTSLPDVSELPGLGFDGWRRWFIDTAALILARSHEDAAAIFFQTDIKRDGRWIDKGFLVQLAAERVGAHLLWHKVVCRAPPGTVTFGRPAWAHLLCLSRGLRVAPGQSSADVIARLGDMPWARAMGTEACHAAAAFLVKHTACRTVVDPFCGVGTMLAIANLHGLDAIGVELSAKRAERARTLSVKEVSAT